MIGQTTNKKMLSAGEVLALRRNELGISLKQASEDTKVQLKYLEMIESDQYDSFESKVFLTGYIKIYSSYLGLNIDKVLAVYRRSQSKEKDKNRKKQGSAKLSLPTLPTKALLVTFLLGAILFIILFFTYQLYNFQRVPELVIITPENNVKVKENSLEIIGYAEPNTAVSINGRRIEFLEDGINFNHTIDLVQGLNTITIRAYRINNESRESIEILSISFEPPEELIEDIDDEIEEVPVERFLKISISGGSAWVSIFVDGEQKVAQVLNNGYEMDYLVEREFSITSGVVNVTQLQFDNTPLRWNINDGVGVIRCVLDNDSLNCDN